jgi:Prokaryotic membrane lipoprotein lipid attachment site
MKKIILPFLILSVLAACNSKEDKKHEGHSGHTKEIPATKQDSLYAEVMAGHDEVMPKIGAVKGAQKEAQRLLDSVVTLPAKAQAGAAALKTKLQTLINDLNYADFAMDKWMVEFNMDSVKDDIEKRIQYLTDEKMKVGKVKDAIINSLATADSLLKRKF